MISFGDKVLEGIDGAEDIIERNTRLAARKAKKAVSRSEKRLKALNRKYREEAEGWSEDLQDYGRSLIKSVSKAFRRRTRCNRSRRPRHIVAGQQALAEPLRGTPRLHLLLTGAEARLVNSTRFIITG